MKTLPEITGYINAQYTPENWAYCKEGGDLEAWQEVIQLIDPDVAICILELIKKHHIKTGGGIHEEHILNAVFRAVQTNAEDMNVFWENEHVYRQFEESGFNAVRTAIALNIKGFAMKEKLLIEIEQAMPAKYLADWKSISIVYQKRLAQVFYWDVHKLVRWFAVY